MQQFVVQKVITIGGLRVPLRLSCMVRESKDILDLCPEEDGLICNPYESLLLKENRKMQGRKMK